MHQYSVYLYQYSSYNDLLYFQSCQNSCLLYNNMKTIKSTGKVNKQTFFDRVRNYSQKDFELKQKIDINHIRQSNYKLQRTKSFRTDHSLQRKVPIIAQKLQYSKSKQHLHKGTVQTEISEDLNEKNYKFRLQDYFRHNKENEWKSNIRDSQKSCQKSQFFKNRKKQNNNMHFNQILALLKTGLSKNQKTEAKQTSSKRDSGCLDLQQEEQCLHLIKIVWQGISLMKQRPTLREEAIKMEDLLKRQVIKLAKPKLEILQEASALSLKIFPFGTTPLENGVSIKQQQQLSVGNFNIQSQSDEQSSQEVSQSHNCGSKTSEQESKQQLEYKKIMYILEQNKKNKLTDRIQESKIQEQVEKDNTISNEKNKISSDQVVRKRQKMQYLSSFNSSVSADRQTIYEQEKANKSYSNDKLFLKNIVKKAKKIDTRLQQSNPNYFNKISAENRNNNKVISSMESEVCESKVQQSEELAESFKDESKTISLQNSQTAINFSKYHGNSKVTSEAQSAKSDGQSRRTTLNNIVNMLNQRYNKKIKLQPPK